jgi:hypothetical protein
MGGRNLFLAFLFFILPFVTHFAGCQKEAPVEKKLPKREPATIIKFKRTLLSQEQRAELAFSDDVIAKVELSAGAPAEPFFTTILVHSENLKGEKGLEEEKLAGFSVRTKNADELITAYRSGLRVRGYLIFKSQRAYGSLPDTVTVVKGNNSYDLLKIQSTEAVSYKLSTEAIIAWLKARQKEGSFVVTGAGQDWIEAKFVRQPADMLGLAKKIYAFAPDVLHYGPHTADKLAERIKKTNGFYLIWD